MTDVSGKSAGSPETRAASTGGESKADGKRGVARRQLLRAGLVAAPMVVTLRGRPASAAAPSLGSVGIFYGVYAKDKDSGEWVPVTKDGQKIMEGTRREEVTLEPLGEGDIVISPSGEYEVPP